MPPIPPETFSDAVDACRRNRVLLSDLVELYADLDEDIRRAGDACRACGACCDFRTAGHRLFASTGEFALLVESAPPAASVRPLECPYLNAGRCTVRPWRPLGCRAYFCEGGARQHPEGRYERFHARIRRLHQSLWAPYAYAELTAGLSQLSVST